MYCSFFHASITKWSCALLADELNPFDTPISGTCRYLSSRKRTAESARSRLRRSMFSVMMTSTLPARTSVIIASKPSRFRLAALTARSWNRIAAAGSLSCCTMKAFILRC